MPAALLPADTLRPGDFLFPEPVQRVHAEPRERRVIPRLGGRHGVGRAVHELERGERRDRALSRQRTRRAQLLQKPGLQNPAVVLLPQRAWTRRLGILRLQTRYITVSENATPSPEHCLPWKSSCTFGLHNLTQIRTSTVLHHLTQMRVH